jgi:hypothetical protein
MKTKPPFEPHLTANEVRLPKGGEWSLISEAGACRILEAASVIGRSRTGRRRSRQGSILVLSAKRAGSFARQPVERGGDHLFLRGNPKIAWIAEFARAALSQAGRRPENSGRARARPRQPDAVPIQNLRLQPCRQCFFDAFAPAPIFYGRVRMRDRAGRGRARALDGWARAVQAR